MQARAANKNTINAAAALLFTALALAMQCAAQDFPSRPIRFVVPYGTGASPDVLARTIGQKIDESVGQRVIVENRAGASGILAAEIVAKAPPDGYTLLVASVPHLAINPALYAKLPYNPLKDFAPVTLAVTTPLFLTVRTSLPVRSVKELIAYAKAHPGLPYGSASNGSQHHLGMELLKVMAGVEMTHIPYKGAEQSVPAILAGDTSLMLVGLPSVQRHVQAGKLHIIAVADAERSPLMPDVPTIAESGFPGYKISPEIGFVAPAGTPKEVIGKLNREIVKALKIPELARQFVSMGINPVGSTPEQYAETLRPNMELYAKLVRISGAKVD
jgi:tripartite-type tricarboxylate transporter receptor subunit TctC